ncbi:hypothetical protein CPC16_011801 [Podila verticillata]|nr:hypothetical protein CPC16_011801 [Podila verticillata]
MATHSANPNTPQGTKRRRRQSDDPTPLPLWPQADVTRFDYPIHPNFKNDISLFGDLRSFFATSLLRADQEHLDLAYAMDMRQLHADFMISSGLLAMDLDRQSVTVREAALAALEVGGPYSNFEANYNAWLQGVDIPNTDTATAGTEPSAGLLSILADASMTAVSASEAANNNN